MSEGWYGYGLYAGFYWTEDITDLGRERWFNQQ